MQDGNGRAEHHSQPCANCAVLDTNILVTNIRSSVTEAMQVASHLHTGGRILRTAAGTAFLSGLSTVMLTGMLISAGVVAVAVLTSLRYLPGGAELDPTAAPATTR